MAALRERPSAGRGKEGLSPELKLVSTFLVILLVSLARSGLFVETAAAFELGCLCLLKGEVIARILKKVLVAGLFALVIFLPAFWLGRSPNSFFICAKVLLAALAAAVFSATTPWSAVSRAFSSLRIPDVFVLTLDMTIKYISLLGGLVLNLLYALKLRSVGRDNRKISSLAGIAGTLFLKSKDAAQTQYEAMECRCFSGTYRTRSRPRSDWRTLALALADLAIVAAFFAFGRV